MKSSRSSRHGAASLNINVTFSAEVKSEFKMSRPVGEIFNLTQIHRMDETEQKIHTPRAKKNVIVRNLSIPKLSIYSPSNSALTPTSATVKKRSSKKKKIVGSIAFLTSRVKSPSKEEIVADAKMRAMLTQSKSRIQKHIKELFEERSPRQRVQQISQFEKSPFIAEAIRQERNELIRYSSLMNLMKNETRVRQEYLARLTNESHLYTLSKEVDPHNVERIIELQGKIHEFNEKLNFEEWEEQKMEHVLRRTKKELEFQRKPLAVLKEKL